MLKNIRQSNNIKYAATISIVLHCVIIAILFYILIYHQNNANREYNSSHTNSIITDTNVITQQYNNYQQKTTIQHENKKSYKYQDPKTTKTETQFYLEPVHNKYLTEQKTIKTQQISQLKQKKQKQKNKVIQNKDNIIKYKKEKIEKFTHNRTKPKTTYNTKLNNDSNRNITTKTTKQYSNSLKHHDDVDKLLRSLVNSKDQFGRVSKNDNIKKHEINNKDISIYKSQLKKVISSNFYYDKSNYKEGEICDLKIKLAPDGSLMSIKAIGGSTKLCRAALQSVKLATMPIPPNIGVYEVFKNTIIRFYPY